MTLGFKDRFEPFIMDGSKTHSIRGGERWSVGMRADLYVRMRQPDMRLLFRAPVVRVEPIRISLRQVEFRPDNFLVSLAIEINGQLLDDDEANALAWRDGFRDSPVDFDGPSEALNEMTWFWLKEHGAAGDMPPFEGQIVHWDYSKRWDVNGECSIDQLAAAVYLLGYFPSRAGIEALTQPERRAIEKWCHKSHLRASDNPVRLGPRPPLLHTVFGRCEDCGAPHMESCACG
jgi:hypothetical protein